MACVFSVYRTFLARYLNIRVVHGRDNISVKMPHAIMNNKPDHNTDINEPAQETTIPVVHEVLEVGKTVVVTGKVRITTHTTEEEVQVNIPVRSEHYDVQTVSSTETFDTPPPVRQEGDTTIIPIIEEIVVTTKRYRVIEEVRIVKRHTETPYLQEISLKKQHVKVERTNPNDENTNINH